MFRVHLAEIFCTTIFLYVREVGILYAELPSQTKILIWRGKRRLKTSARALLGNKHVL